VLAEKEGKEGCGVKEGGRERERRLMTVNK
jgi:hypothetical protein